MGTVSDFYNLKRRYGAKGNGIADDTVPFQDFLEDLRAKVHPIFGGNYRQPRSGWVPHGDYMISQPLRLMMSAGQRLRAAPGTRLTYTGTDDIPGIIQAEGESTNIEGFSFYGNARAGIRVWRMTPSTFIVTQHVIRDCHFFGSYRDCIAIDSRGVHPGAADINNWNYRGTWNVGTAYAVLDTVSYGATDYVAIAPSTGAAPNVSPAKWTALAALSTQNSEYHSVFGCTFRGYGERYTSESGGFGGGVTIYGSQSHNNLFEDCKFYGTDNGTSKAGLYAYYGSHGFARRCYFENNFLDIWWRDFHQGWEVSSCKTVGSSHFVTAGNSGGGVACSGLLRGNYVDHGANLGLGETDDSRKPRSVLLALPGPTRVVGNYFVASNLKPHVVASGSINLHRIELDANAFRGPTNYFRAVTAVSYPSVPTTITYQGGIDFAGNTVVRQVGDFGTNIYWDNTTSSWDTHLLCNTTCQVQGLASDGGDPTSNAIAWIDFPDGGGATQTVTLDYTEAADYNVHPGKVRITGGAAPVAVVTAKLDDTVPLTNVTMTSVTMTLSAAPVGWSARIPLIFWRAP